MNDTTTKMRELLARWAEVEPARCRCQLKANGELERILILTPYGWQLTLDTEEPEEYYPNELHAGMCIQLVIQQAIVERNLSLDIRYGSSGWDVFIDGYEGFAKGKKTVVEALLEAYLDILE